MDRLEEELPEYAQQEGYSMTATEPDESRLLSDEEVKWLRVAIIDILEQNIEIEYETPTQTYSVNGQMSDDESRRLTDKILQSPELLQLIEKRAKAQLAKDMEHEQARVEEARMAGIKEVGEWLEHTRNYPTMKDVEALKKGEMPE